MQLNLPNYQQHAPLAPDSTSSNGGSAGSGSTEHGPPQGAAAKQQGEESPSPLQLQAALPQGFNFNRVVAVVAYDRFEYFRQVRLDCLAFSALAVLRLHGCDVIAFHAQMWSHGRFFARSVADVPLQACLTPPWLLAIHR